MPRKDEPLEGVVGGDVEILDALHCGRTCCFHVGEEPFFDVFALVGDPCGDGHRFFH